MSIGTQTRVESTALVRCDATARQRPPGRLRCTAARPPAARSVQPVAWCGSRRSAWLAHVSSRVVVLPGRAPSGRAGAVRGWSREHAAGGGTAPAPRVLSASATPVLGQRPGCGLRIRWRLVAATTACPPLGPRHRVLPVGYALLQPWHALDHRRGARSGPRIHAPVRAAAMLSRLCGLTVCARVLHARRRPAWPGGAGHLAQARCPAIAPTPPAPAPRGGGARAPRRLRRTSSTPSHLPLHNPNAPPPPSPHSAPTPHP